MPNSIIQDINEGKSVPVYAGPAIVAKHDPVNSPHHYTSLGAKCETCGAGIECITITEHFDFNLGNAIKYIWRAGLKNGKQDYEKARWYINRALHKLEEDEAEVERQIARAAFARQREENKLALEKKRQLSASNAQARRRK